MALAVSNFVSHVKFQRRPRVALESNFNMVLAALSNLGNLPFIHTEK